MTTTKATGGYLMAQTDLVRAGSKSHTNALDRPISQAHLDALNAIQATGWRVNQFILDVASEVWTGDLRLAGVEQTYTQSIPGRLTDDQWAALADAGRTGHMATQAAAYAHNASARGKSFALLEALSVAEELRGQETIWFPHSLDFRGRVYPIATGPLNPAVSP